MKVLSLCVLLFSTLSFSQLLTAGNLGCDNVIDFSDYKGRTFLSFMENVGKPLLDDYAINGYEIADADTVMARVEQMDSKVQWQVGKALNRKSLKKIVKKLEGKTANLYTLPDMISSVQRGVNKYKLSTTIGLASCGGMIMKLYENNYAYNIHYGTGSERKDKQTGRSFAEGPTRNANDASDKNYLKDLEAYTKDYPENIQTFYYTLLTTLTNNDTETYNLIEDHGQDLLTDFLAVYTAEQARNLMDNKVSLHWDAALLEVTLLGAFHAGQNEIALFYKDPRDPSKLMFTDTVINQGPGCSERDLSKSRQAFMYDYWQFSSSVNPEHCKRSGINITKKEFRKLGSLISKYHRAKNPTLIKNIEKHFSSRNRGGNVFYQLSKFLINSRTPKKLGSKSYKLAEDFTKFLLQVRKDAKLVTKKIVNKQLK